MSAGTNESQATCATKIEYECRSCNEVKSLTEFSESSRYRECKVCNSKRGKANYKPREKPLRKLTDEQVENIRRDKRPQRELAKIYGVSKSNIGAIKVGKTWLPNPKKLRWDSLDISTLPPPRTSQPREIIPRVRLPKFKDMTGQRFGRLVALSVTDKRTKNGQAYWRFKCDCGNEKDIIGSMVRTGGAVSCGCYHSECAKAIQYKYLYKHGKTHSPIWNIYQGMMSRCYDSSNVNHFRYGGRGIFVDPSWHNFEVFYRDMGDPPAGLTLDRRNNDLGYSKDNCHWATPKEQANNRRSNKLITFNGIIMNQKQWAEKIGISHKVLHARFAAGWSVDDALTRPHRTKGALATNWKTACEP